MQRDTTERHCPGCRRPLTREEVDWCDDCQQQLPRCRRSEKRYAIIKEPRILAHIDRIGAELERLEAMGGVP